MPANERPSRREPLSRDRVLQTAVELADEVGVGGVSMRRLAQRLGVVPMALYKHVTDKEELLDGMVDAVIAGFATPDRRLDWKDDIRQQLLSARRAVLRHPWARRAIESRTRRSAAVLGHMDAVAGTFLAAGFSADQTHHLMHALGNRIWGFSPELFDDSTEADRRPAAEDADVTDRAELAARFAQHFPHIVAIATAAGAGAAPDASSGCDEQFEFEFALDLLLDAAERLRDTGWSSGGSPRGQAPGD